MVKITLNRVDTPVRRCWNAVLLESFQSCDWSTLTLYSSQHIQPIINLKVSTDSASIQLSIGTDNDNVAWLFQTILINL